MCPVLCALQYSLEAVPRFGYTCLSMFSMYMSGNIQQVRLQSLFIKCEIILINEINAPLIKEMIKKKVIIRNIKVRMK
jgi:hypothetical protein